jgi:hypothetical protein
VYESRVDRFRGRPNAPRIADKAPMVPALWVRPGQGYLDTVVGTSYCTVEAVLIEHWPLCRVNGRILLVSSFLHGTAVVGAEDFPSILGLQHRTCEASYTAFPGVDHQELDRLYRPSQLRSYWKGTGCLPFGVHAGSRRLPDHAAPGVRVRRARLATRPPAPPGARAGLRVRPQSTIAW